MSLRRSRRGGEHDGNHVKPIEEVLAEGPLLDLLFKVTVGGGDDAHVDADRLPPAHALELTLLQDPQHLDLKLGTHVPDLVEKDRPAVGQFELARRVGNGARKGAAAVAEKLALEQALGGRSAVDRHEGLAAAWRALVDQAREHALARPGLPVQQNRGVADGGLLHDAQDALHRGALRHQARHGDGAGSKGNDPGRRAVGFGHADGVLELGEPPSSGRGGRVLITGFVMDRKPRTVEAP